MMFLDRRKTGEEPFLRLRMWLLGIGGFLALFGISLEMGWLVNVAIGVLVVGFGLRFAGRARVEWDDDDAEEEDAEDLDAGEPRVR